MSVPDRHLEFYKERGYRDRRLQPPPVTSTLTLDTTRSSIASDVRSRSPETAHFLLPDDENLKLRIFIDRSVVEVFANDVQCVAARVYPDREDSTGVLIRSQGSASQLVSLDAYQMADVYA